MLTRIILAEDKRGLGREVLRSRLRKKIDPSLYNDVLGIDMNGQEPRDENENRGDRRWNYGPGDC